MRLLRERQHSKPAFTSPSRPLPALAPIDGVGGIEPELAAAYPLGRHHAQGKQDSVPAITCNGHGSGPRQINPQPERERRQPRSNTFYCYSRSSHRTVAGNSFPRKSAVCHSL